MPEFKILGYTVESQKAFGALFKAGADKETVLKKIDSNNDMKISEDELACFIGEDDLNFNDSVSSSSSSSAADKAAEQLMYYDKLNNTLEERLNSLYNKLGTASDSEELETVLSDIENVKSQLNSNEQAIYNILVQEENRKAAEEAQAASANSSSVSGVSSVAQTSATSPISSNTASRLTTGKGISGASDFGSSIVSIAQSYVGKLKESDGSYLQVTGGRQEHWCADFVTYVVKQAAAQTGTSINGFGAPSVSSLMAWGQANNCYGSINGMSASQKSQWIVNNVKPGDVMIMKNNSSHTGIVSKVYPDGSFDTVEGNTSDQCLQRHYAATEAKVSGFVKIT